VPAGRGEEGTTSVSPRSASAGPPGARAEGWGNFPPRVERIVRGRAECPIWECVPRTYPGRCRRTSRSRSYDRGGTCYPRGALNRSTSCLSRDCSRVDRRVGHRSSCRAGKLVVVAGIHSLASAERAVRALTETLATTIGGRKRVRRRVDTSEKCFAARSDAFASPRCGARAYEPPRHSRSNAAKRCLAKRVRQHCSRTTVLRESGRRFNCETKRRSKSTDRSTFPRLRTRARTLSPAR